MRRFHSLHLLLFLLLSLIYINTSAQCNYYIGGELRWECYMGNYRFILKLYRDCSKPPLPNTVNMNSTYPGLYSINLFKTGSKDLTPVCSCPGDTGISCPGSPVTGTLIPTGALEETIYTSDSVYPTGIPLTGVPPPQGWRFWYSGGCRFCSGNMPTCGINAVIVAVMYPYNNTAVDDCIDCAPVFHESPPAAICASSSTTLNYSAYDPDSDSLVYEWAYPLQSTTSPITNWFPGYSINSPLPAGSQLNNEKGLIDFKSTLPGTFLKVVKVTSYRCGIKVSEIYREVYTLVLNCNPTNAPPSITFPTPSVTSHIRDTVTAGDTVSYTISVADMSICPSSSPAVPQTIYFSAIGQQFGAPVNQYGCNTPPCATLTPSPSPSVPLSGVFGLQSTFSWVTTCDLVIPDSSCKPFPRTFDFLFKSWDNYCPAPAFHYTLLTIVVLPKTRLKAPPIQCISVEPNGDVVINWAPLTDSLNTFHSFRLYSSDSPSGPFHPVDTVYTSNSTGTIHHGAGANQKRLFYYLAVTNNCTGFENLSEPFDTVSTIYLNVSNPEKLPDLIHLNWNPVRKPLLTSSSTVYEVWRRDTSASFVLLGSTTDTLYADTVFQSAPVPEYFVSIADTLPSPATACTSVSGIAFPFIHIDDVGVTKILQPSNDTVQGSVLAVEVMINNFGINQQTAFPVSLSVNGSPIVTDQWTGLLLPSDSMLFTFSLPLNVPSVGFHLCAETNLLSDTIVSNNSFCKSFGVLSSTEEIDKAGFSIIRISQNGGEFLIRYILPESGVVSARVLSAVGKTINTSTINSVKGENQTQLDITGLPAGIYLYSLEYKGERLTRKLILCP